MSKTGPQSPGSLTGSTDGLGPLTIITENMTDTDIDRIIEDAKQNDTELFIKDLNGKVTHNYNNTVHGGEENKEKNNLETETSDLELISNLSSSTEIEQETKEHNLRRSKRLTKTNPIIRFNNPITSDYRKHGKQTECPEDTRNRGRYSGKDQQRRILNDTTEGPVQAEQFNRQLMKRGPPRTYQNCYGRKTAIKNKSPPLVNYHPIAEGGVK